MAGGASGCRRGAWAAGGGGGLAGGGGRRVAWCVVAGRLRDALRVGVEVGAARVVSCARANWRACGGVAVAGRGGSGGAAGWEGKCGGRRRVEWRVVAGGAPRRPRNAARARSRRGAAGRTHVGGAAIGACGQGGSGGGAGGSAVRAAWRGEPWCSAAARACWAVIARRQLSGVGRGCVNARGVGWRGVEGGAARRRRAGEGCDAA